MRIPRLNVSIRVVDTFDSRGISDESRRHHSDEPQKTKGAQGKKTVATPHNHKDQEIDDPHKLDVAQEKTEHLQQKPKKQQNFRKNSCQHDSFSRKKITISQFYHSTKPLPSKNRTAGKIPGEKKLAKTTRTKQ